MANLWGPMLTGLSQGLGDYQKSQEDLAYVRQSRADQLAQNQQAQQQNDITLKTQQQALQNADLTNSYWKQALVSTDNQQPTPSQQGQSAAVQAAPAAPGNPQQQQPQSNFKPVGPLSIDQLSQLDQKYNLPKGTAYGLMATESAGNPNAVSQKGAQGLFQVMPTTAARPGYGLKAFDPKDPDGALGYFAKMYQKAGGDMSKALAYWNAGPGGNPQNPETQAFIPKVQKNAQQFAAAQGLDSSKQQPTPAESMQSREAAGAATPVTAYQQATQAQGQQVQTMIRAAQAAEKDGHPELAQQFYERASKLQDQQQTLQKKTLDTQKEANEETSKLAVGVKGQDSYNNFRVQLAQNPVMQSAVAGLNLTGNYEADKNKLQTLADRTLTLKDQHDMALKDEEFKLKQQADQRKQQKEDQVKVAYEQVQTQDANRQAEVQAKGLPFAPSVVASLPPGTPPAAIQKAAQSVQKAQIEYQKNNMNALGASKQTQSLASGLIGLLHAQDPVQTGGYLRGMSTTYTDWAKSGNSPQAAKQQEFDKLSNQLVTAATQALGAAGGGRSSFTAAMYDRVKTQKPSLQLSPEVNARIAGEYYNIAAFGQNKAQFMNEYMAANQGALPQTGELQWAAYEQALGPVTIVDPDAPSGYRLNTAGVPKLPDGRPNPNYKDYHDFFKQGGGQ